ncbi:uncharacterized protein MONOS_17197 [Monocercomonoides exilis]|uniref:uncharacterized protein n=1 Tax=Monocercomonoides exilis TaxID=2049356 RepID=UPI00355991C6|nr:hypothetical protein MONOS_17197 [Monocercomonoides exilis]
MTTYSFWLIDALFFIYVRPNSYSYKLLIDTTSRTRNMTFYYKWLHPPFSAEFRVRKICAVSSVQEGDIG